MSQPTRQATVSLREVTPQNLRAVLSLQVTEHQKHLVATNAESIAEAYFERDHAWFRAIYADENPVGFVMLYIVPEKPLYYVWRLMLDARYQGLGFGERAMREVIDYVRGQPSARELLVSYVPGDDSPVGFYSRLGFVETGEVQDGEHVMKLVL